MLQLFKKIGLLVVASMISLSSLANGGIPELPIKTINGKQYHYYEVQPQETVYSLCRRFGITREELLAENPSVANGLKAYQTLLFAVSGAKQSKQSVSSTNTSVAEYKVQRGETGYGISRKFGMTLDEFYQLNPEAVDGIKSGDYVKVKSDSSELVKSNVQTSNIGQDAPGTYSVKSGDTFFGIAQRYGLGVDQLRQANPGVEMLKAGMVLTLPQACDENPGNQVAVVQQEDAPEDTPLADSETTMSGRHRLTKEDAAEVDTLVIALALPLKASAKKRDVRAYNTLEFYRGFMLAVDSLRNYGKPLKVMTFDTDGSDECVAQILQNPALRSAHVILAPDATTQLASFAKFASENEIYLLNQFVIKDQTYLTNPYVLQSNIPQKAMYQKAVDYYLSSFSTDTPVFLKRSDGKVDKLEFVNQLKKALSAAGRKYHEIEFKDKLSLTTLSQLPAGVGYAFIPVSSSISELNRFVSAVTEFKAERIDSNVSLWGYAEWLTARGKTLESLHLANSYIFSRFYSVDNDYAQDELQNYFRRWYGVGIVDRVPRQGVYGFDTGMFLIRALNSNNGDFRKTPVSYFGVQNSFEFIEEANGGLVNDEMFIINFAPGNTIFKFGL